MPVRAGHRPSSERALWHLSAADLRASDARHPTNRPAFAWDEFKLSADEFYEDGDTVVVLGHTPVVHIWRFRGDDEVCRLQILTDTLQGARMLGKA